MRNIFLFLNIKFKSLIIVFISIHSYYTCIRKISTPHVTKFPKQNAMQLFVLLKSEIQFKIISVLY